MVPTDCFFVLTGAPQVPATSDDGVYWYNSGGVGLFVTEIYVRQVLHPSLDEPRRGGGKRKN